MAHIVYLTTGITSYVNSALGLSRQLRDAGHKVSLVSPSEVSLSGDDAFDYYQVRRDAEFVTHTRSRPPLRSFLGNPVALFRELRVRRLIRSESLQNGEISELLKRIKPDLLIIDIEFHFAILSTFSLPVPRLLATVWFSPLKSVDLPPLHSRHVPDGSIRSRVITELLWLRLRLGRRLDEIRSVSSPRGIMNALRPVTYLTANLQNLKSLARTLGLSSQAVIDRNQWLRPCMAPDLPILSLNAKELEFPSPRTERLHYVGPMINARRPTHGPASDEITWMKAKEKLPKSSPLVYCSLGSFWKSDVTLLTRIIAVFRTRRDWQLVIGLGGTTPVDSLGPTPDNVIVFRWAPQLDILRVADAAITHGGIASINECILSGVPLAVYSTGHVDQDGCAARVAYHGVGVVGDYLDGPDAIERNIELVLTNEEIKGNVSRMRRQFEKYQTSMLAARTVASYL